MDDALLLRVKQTIAELPQLHSARFNRDYLTIGIEIAPLFPDLAKRVDLVDGDGNKAWTIMVPVDDVKAAMQFEPAPPRAV